MLLPAVHEVLGTAYAVPVPSGMQTVVFGMGCFWGAERKFWTEPGVWRTAVGYAGGHQEHPRYEEVCSGQTGHTEVVQVVWDPSKLDLKRLLTIFWENHDPTQGNRQGNDIGTQYRSAIYLPDESDLSAVFDSRGSFQHRLRENGYGAITTEIRVEPIFYYAEPYHQQYLHKNPNGYCGLGGTGVRCQGI